MAVLLVIFILLPRRLYFIPSRSGEIIWERVTKSLISDRGGFAVCRKKVSYKKGWDAFFYAFFPDATTSGLIAGFPRSDR